MICENILVNRGDRLRVAGRKIGPLFMIGSLIFSGFTHAAGELGETPPSMPDPRATYSPYLQDTFPNQVFFGDTHLHTAYSADAGFFLNRLTPDDSFSWARGETVTSSTGVPSKIVRPLDFLVVSDHAETFGLAIAIQENHPALLKTEWGRTLLELAEPDTPQAWGEVYLYWAQAFIGEDGPPEMDLSFMADMWGNATASAERYNSPGLFTAFIGYEWTSGPAGNNLHRVVVYRGDKEEADQVVPFSALESSDPERLWDWMEAYEADTGGRVLAIAHNGNLSNGLMFDDVTLTNREPLDERYAKRRRAWEPLYEVTQMKGDGEAHPSLSPDDEFADYFTWDVGSFGPQLKTPDMLPKEYAREALKRGMQYEKSLGTNPFKFGMIGSTDSHTSLSTTDEANFFGKIAAVEPTADPIRFSEIITGRLTPDDPTDDQTHEQALAAGLAGVWARDNTREALWDAMKRKEVFATTGTRMRVRVFAGFDYVEEDLYRSDFARHGYANGVPMGGDLTAAADGEAPSLLIAALRDPDGANLDRIQVVKGWTNDDGSAAEQVYDVSWSGDRQKDAKGKVPAVGNTVDIETASYSNSIGAPILSGYWKDPDFDPDQHAFYYVRVLEIPTPNWTTYDHVFLGVELSKKAVAFSQERAYTSPVWYTP